MVEYYVSGCIDNGSEIQTCDDSEATFWTLYQRGNDGLSQGIIDCTFREDAEAAMRVYQERDSLVNNNDKKYTAICDVCEPNNEMHCICNCEELIVKVPKLDLQQRLQQAETHADNGWKTAKAMAEQCDVLQRQVKDLNEHLEEIYRAIDWSNARFEQTGDSPFDAINDLRLGAKVWWGKGQ